MNENTDNQTPQLPTEPQDTILNEPSTKTIGKYLRESEMYDILLRLKIYVENKFTVNQSENLPPQ